MMMMIVDL